MRTRFPMYLVGLNLALIALVLFLVLRTDGDDKPLPATGATREADALSVAAAGGAEVMAEVGAATATTTNAADDATMAIQTDTAPTATSLAAASDVVVVAPLASIGGQRAGEVLATLDEAVFAGEVSLTIRVHPAGATVAVAGHGTGRAPRTIVARRGAVLSLRVSAPDHEARTLEVVAGDEPVTVTLKAIARGRVQFKFFPAEGTRVVIDGKAIAVGSNVVSTELPVGKHTLVLETTDGRRVVRPFEIEEGQTTSLGTLDVGRGG